MNVRLCVLLSFFINLLGIITAHATPEISYFDKGRDLAQVITILKAEWSKLFLEPFFNPYVITRMFNNHSSGDSQYWDKPLQIKVIREHDQLLGFVTYFYSNPTTVLIELLAINKQFQSQGIGKLMVQEVINEAVGKGAHAIELNVYPSNERAVKFYLNLGFNIKSRLAYALLLTKEIGN